MIIPLDEFGVLAVIVIIAGVVNGATGFGFAIVSLVGFALIVDPKLAVILLSLMTPGLNVQQLHFHWPHRGVIRRIRWVLPAALVGSVIGTRLLIIMPAFLLSMLLGLFALWYAVSSIKRGPVLLRRNWEPWATPSVGLLAGVANGAVGAAGPVLGSYMLAIGLREREWIFAVSAAFGVMAVGGVATLALASQYRPDLVLQGIGLTIPAFIGQRIGFAVQRRFSATTFQRIILLVLLIASANLLVRGAGTAAATLLSLGSPPTTTVLHYDH